jgi:hypothetical protein
VVGKIEELTFSFNNYSIKSKPQSSRGDFMDALRAQFDQAKNNLKAAPGIPGVFLPSAQNPGKLDSSSPVI